jgi:DNA polymerase I-like protein with 3'-5' exonuclease and polymerase domains
LLELPLIAVLVTMERNGVELDANALGKQQLDVITSSQAYGAPLSILT